jgi:MFS family permease
MNPLIPRDVALTPLRSLTRNQVRGFWAAWGGWALDGMDSFIYALVLVPALKDLLPRSGIPATTGNVGYYGGLLLALFLIGWGLAFLWGPVADKFGRASAFSFATSTAVLRGRGSRSWSAPAWRIFIPLAHRLR